MDVGARQIYLNISETADLLAFTYKIIPRVYSVLAWKRENIQYVSVLWPKMPCWCLRSRRRDNNSNNHLFQPSYAKELIWAQKTPLTLQADAIQQPKTTTICTGWPKLDNRSLEKCCLIRRLRIMSKPHDRMTPSCIIYIWSLNWWSWGKGAEDIFLAYIELLSTNRETFNCHSLHGSHKAATQDISQSYFNFVSEQHNWARAQSVPVVHQVPHYILQTALRNFLSPSNPYGCGVCVCHRGHRVFCEIMLQLYLELCSSSWLANLAKFSQ